MKRSETPKIGLVIGKFTQFHNGHVDLLKFALKIVDKVFVVVYHSPDKTSVPLPERAGWIRSFFPHENIVVIEGWNAPNHHEDTPQVRRIQEEYLGNVLAGIYLTHIISSEDYGDHLSKYFDIENIIYDKQRIKRPISSTMIREDFATYSKHVPKAIRERVKEDIEVRHTWSTNE
jgi:HTH-type transcriptional repressor of NAD biosynthesis genes